MIDQGFPALSRAHSAAHHERFPGVGTSDGWGWVSHRSKSVQAGHSAGSDSSYPNCWAIRSVKAGWSPGSTIGHPSIVPRLLIEEPRRRGRGGDRKPGVQEPATVGELGAQENDPLCGDLAQVDGFLMELVTPDAHGLDGLGLDCGRLVHRGRVLSASAGSRSRLVGDLSVSRVGKDPDRVGSADWSRHDRAGAICERAALGPGATAEVILTLVART